MASRRGTSRGVWFRHGGDLGRRRRLDLDHMLLPHERAALGSWHWEIWGRDAQLPPEGPWRVWLIRAGRGFGKTRAGAEWVRNVARYDGTARIALVAASLGEARSVMVEGESGVLAASPGALAPEFEPSLRRLQWPNGAQAFLYAAGEPESLRGPQHSHAWCAGAEGSIRQRSPRPDRRVASLRDRRHCQHPADEPGRGNGMARRERANRRLERAGGQRGLPAVRPMAVRSAARRLAAAQPRQRAGHAIFRDLAGARPPRRP